jgi:regulator of sirC expression with transglutaminase-like and TPR domain
MTSVGDPRAALAAELARPPEDVRLERAALLIAAEEYPGLDVDGYLARIDELAAGARSRLSGDEGRAGVLAAINGYLFRELGFRGNRDDYYDPGNSYLNEVLERRTGIPITLSVLYIAVARGLHHRLIGLDLPIHFMVAWPSRGVPADEPLLVDPFEGGTIVTVRDCAERLERILGHPVELGPEHFAPADPRRVVRRMLNNLFAIYVGREDYRRALAALERMHLAAPLVEDLRDRGLLLYRLGRHPEAEESLHSYLAAAPTAHDRGAVERHIDWIRRLRAEST